MAWTKPQTINPASGGDSVNLAVHKCDQNVDAIVGHLNTLKSAFGSATAPTAPETGQRWSDTGNTAVKGYTGTAWHQFSWPHVVGAATIKQWFYQQAAPEGWQLVAATGDRVIGVKGGTQAYNVAGGTQAGTWTVPAHSHACTDHAHTSFAHNHTLNRIAALAGTPESAYYPPAATNDSTASTGSGGPAATATFTPDGTWRPYAAVGIVCAKVA